MFLINVYLLINASAKGGSGSEALIGVQQAEDSGTPPPSLLRVIHVSPDKDMLQLIAQAGHTVLVPRGRGKSQALVMDSDDVALLYSGVPANLLTDYMALAGDAAVRL